MKQESKKKSIVKFKGMKLLDSYRLLDLLISATLGILSVVFIFMISLGYDQIPNFVEEIARFPYFIAFLPAFLSSLTHSIINYFASLHHNHSLIDFTKKEDKGEARYALFIALAGTIISFILIILFLTNVIKSAEEYLYVLASLPLGLFPFAYLLFNQVLLIYKSELDHKGLRLALLLVVAIVPLALGLGTYFPGVIGYTYFGVAFLPFVYLIGDALNMSKGYSDINPKEPDELL